MEISLSVLAGDILIGKEMKEMEFIWKISPVAPGAGERVSSALGPHPGSPVGGGALHTCHQVLEAESPALP